MFRELDLVFPYLFNIEQKFQNQLLLMCYLTPYQLKYFQASSLDGRCLNYGNKKQRTKFIK